jgi:hypothetical protein
MFRIDIEGNFVLKGIKLSLSILYTSYTLILTLID